MNYVDNPVLKFCQSALSPTTHLTTILTTTMNVALLTTNLLGCQEPTPSSDEFGEEAHTLASPQAADADALRLRQAQHHPVKGVTVSIATTLYTKIYRDSQYRQPIRLTITHPTDTWMIKSYFVGGQVHDNTSDTPENGQLIFNHVLSQSNHFITLIIRNISLCKTVLTDEQCHGKHSLRPISEGLETYFLVPIKTSAPDTHPPTTIEPDELTDVQIPAHLYYELLTMLQDNCDIDKSEFKLEFTTREQLSRSIPHWIKLTNNIGKKNGPELLMNLATAIDTASTPQTQDMKQTEQQINQTISQCRNQHQEWMEANYKDKIIEP